MKNFFFKKVYSRFGALLMVTFTIGFYSYLYFSLLSVHKTHKLKVPVVEIANADQVVQYPYKKDYDFTTDWFTKNIPIWEKVLAPFAGKPNIQYLEIGVFEGRASVWMLENILTHATSHLTGMDLFIGDYEGAFPKFGERYFANIAATGSADRTTNIRGFSQIELRKLPLDSYHIIYIDGSHANRDVLEDAILSLRLLKSDGVLIFDDYGRGTKINNPQFGIDTFARYFIDDFDVLHNDHQVVFRKK